MSSIEVTVNWTSLESIVQSELNLRCHSQVLTLFMVEVVTICPIRWADLKRGSREFEVLIQSHTLSFLVLVFGLKYFSRTLLHPEHRRSMLLIIQHKPCLLVSHYSAHNFQVPQVWMSAS